MNKVTDLFVSPKVTLGLFALLVLLLVPTTFLPENTYILFIPIRVVLGVIGLNLLVCTFQKLKTLRRSTLVIHIGVITILAGALAGTFGFVATVNLYEGTSVDNAFRWDVEQDVSLGFTLHVTQIHFDYYPVSVKVGILKNGEKADLIVTRTGDSFEFEGYRVHVESFHLFDKKLQLALETRGGKSIGTMNTSGQKEVPPDFPLDFKLVAFQDPTVKRFWVDMELRNGDTLIAEGASEVNNPLKWNGMQFFLTQVSSDENGNAFAGIQISKDPGLPVVYSGFLIFFAGILLALKRWSASSNKQLGSC